MSKGSANLSDIKKKVKTTLGKAKDEILRTADIGKKMIDASQLNSEINDQLRKLGGIIYQQIKDQKLNFKGQEDIETIIANVDQLQDKMKDCEEKVDQIKNR
jgi:hypothetical protein